MKRWFTLSLIVLFFTQCSDFNSKKKQEEQWGKAQKLATPLITKNRDTISHNTYEKSPQQTGVPPVHKKQKKKKQETPVTSQAGKTSRLSSDSHIIQRMLWLRSQNIEIDMNEPKSKEFLLSPVETGKFPSMIMLSRDRLLRIDFDNDILDNTDRFYTNGIRFDFISPVFQRFPLNLLMVPYWRNATNYYGISLVQNMYTPSTTKIGGILYGDRPYAAYLYLKNFKITNDYMHRFRQTSGIDLGVIGPSSMGDFVQKSFHNNVPTNSEPLGWEYQIRNDLVLDYSLSYEKGIVHGRNLEVNISGMGTLGTLYTNIGGGIMVRTGVFNPYFLNLGIEKWSESHKQGLHRTQLYFSLKSNFNFVGYDATLEGGVFNTTSSYTIGYNSVTRFVYQGSASITFAYGGFEFNLEQVLLSPEFHNGWWHKWVHIGLTIAL
jgi:lipid A 3-O-deacylase